MKKETPSFEQVMATRDLSGMDLSGFSLGACDLSGKCFRDADLSYAQLGKAVLVGTDLRHANLSNANLGAADLSGADLRYADLREANVNGVILLGADLRKTLGMEQPFAVTNTVPFQPMSPIETKDFKAAREEGFAELNHWAKTRCVKGKRIPIHEDVPVWRALRNQFGEVIFSSQETFGHTRLVQQYIDYPRWTYLLTADGFEMIMKVLGFQVVPYKPEEAP